MIALVDLGIVSQNLLGRSHHLDAIKNIHDSWEEVQISTFTGIWKKLIPTVRDNLEGFKA